MSNIQDSITLIELKSQSEALKASIAESRTSRRRKGLIFERIVSLIKILNNLVDHKICDKK